MIKPAPTLPPATHIRAHFILQGTSYAAWCRRHGFGKATFCKLISGRYKGIRPVTKRMKEALVKELRKAG